MKRRKPRRATKYLGKLSGRGFHSKVRSTKKGIKEQEKLHAQLLERTPEVDYFRENPEI